MGRGGNHHKVPRERRRDNLKLNQTGKLKGVVCMRFKQLLLRKQSTRNEHNRAIIAPRHRRVKWNFAKFHGNRHPRELDGRRRATILKPHAKPQRKGASSAISVPSLRPLRLCVRCGMSRPYLKTSSSAPANSVGSAKMFGSLAAWFMPGPNADECESAPSPQSTDCLQGASAPTPPDSVG